MRLPLPKAAAAVAAATLLAALAFVPRPGQAQNERPAQNERSDRPMLAHMVFFTLKDSSTAGREKLVAACKKYLTGHDGTVHFSAGARAAEFDRPVNDQEFDVALHVVFKDKAAHDAYQVAERHQKFIDENKETWAKVRVFDSYVTE